MRKGNAGLLLVLAVVVLFGCAPGVGSLAAPEEYGLTGDVDELVDMFEEFDIYAAVDRSTPTVLAFDRKGDGWTMRTRTTFWTRVETRQELMDRIAAMRWAFGQANRLRAVRTPDGEAAAALVYSPAPVGTRVEEQEVVVSSVSLRDACRMVPVQFGSGPCIEVRDRRH